MLPVTYNHHMQSGRSWAWIEMECGSVSGLEGWREWGELQVHLYVENPGQASEVNYNLSITHLWYNKYSQPLAD
jgi:hypothetical protein